jgi:hypothetical protein
VAQACAILDIRDSVRGFNVLVTTSPDIWSASIKSGPPAFHVGQAALCGKDGLVFHGFFNPYSGHPFLEIQNRPSNRAIDARRIV